MARLRQQRRTLPVPRVALTSGERRGMLPGVVRDWLLRLAAFLLLLGVWEGISRLLKPILFASPGRTVEAFERLVRTGALQEAWLETLFVLFMGLSLAMVMGVALGFLFGRYRTASDLFEPELSALFMTPRVALLPIISLWLGFGDPAKILVIFLFSFFDVFYTVRNGVRTIDAEYVEVARAYSLPESMLFTKVIVPASIPFLITGLRLGLIHGMVGVVLVGYFLENNGIGGLIYYEGQGFRISGLFAALFTVALVGVAMNQSLRWLERRAAPWRAGAGV